MGSTLRSNTLRSVTWVASCIYVLSLIHFFPFFLVDVCLFTSSFSLWHMSSESQVYFGFTDDTSRHTQRLDSTPWVIFKPGGQLISSGGIFLGDATNNVVEYGALIEFLCDALSNGIYRLRLYLYAQLVVSQLNGVYCIYDPTLH
jgi:hypothetical protein